MNRDDINVPAEPRVLLKHTAGCFQELKNVGNAGPAESLQQHLH